MALRLVIDTNILIAALLRDSTTRKILLTAPIQFMAPAHMYLEVQEHLPKICKRLNSSLQEMQQMVQLLRKHILTVEIDSGSNVLKEAEELMKDIDPEDAPIFAAALSVRCDGIWSEDVHLRKQDQFRIWRTKDLLHFIKHED